MQHYARYAYDYEDYKEERKYLLADLRQQGAKAPAKIYPLLPAYVGQTAWNNQLAAMEEALVACAAYSRH